MAGSFLWTKTYRLRTFSQSAFPFATIRAQRKTNRNTKKTEDSKEVYLMRHVYIRSIIGVILAGAAIMGGGPICIILSILMLCSAYMMWKKETGDRNDKGEK